MRNAAAQATRHRPKKDAAAVLGSFLEQLRGEPVADDVPGDRARPSFGVHVRV